MVLSPSLYFYSDFNSRLEGQAKVPSFSREDSLNPLLPLLNKKASKFSGPPQRLRKLLSVTSDLARSDSHKDFGADGSSLQAKEIISSNGVFPPTSFIVKKGIVANKASNLMGNSALNNNKIKMSFEVPSSTSTQKNGHDQGLLSHSPSRTQVDWKLVQKTKLTSNQTFLEYYFQTMAGFSEGKTKTNQDSVYLNAEILGSTNCSLFAVFDGHGTLGHKVSDFLKRHLIGRSFC